MPGEKKIHTAKFDRCVKKVKQSGSAVNPYAVCSKSLGRAGAIKKEHRKGEKT